MVIDNLSNEAVNELKQHAIDYIKDNEPTCYGCDLHSEIFNSDYYIIGRYQAEQWLVKHIGVFNAIGEIKEYEESNFGEVNTDLSESEKVVNMIVYIAGEEILSNIESLSDNWNNRLDEEVCKLIIEELEQ
jgi:hypothetical protein